MDGPTLAGMDNASSRPSSSRRRRPRSGARSTLLSTAVLAVALALLAGCGSDEPDLDDQVQGLQTRLAERHQAEAELTARIDALEDALATATADAVASDELDQRLDERLTERLDERFDEELSALDTRFSELSELLGSIEADVEAGAAARATLAQELDATDQELRGAIAELRGAIDELRGSIAVLGDEIDVLRDRVDNHSHPN